MKREVIYAMDGSPVTRLFPENEDDMQELYRLAEAGELDARESFGDDPEAWERWQREQPVSARPRKEYVVVNGVHRLVDAPADNQ
jgi:hypothetical protein